jgi:hypothetical protein
MDNKSEWTSVILMALAFGLVVLAFGTLVQAGAEDIINSVMTSIPMH